MPQPSTDEDSLARQLLRLMREGAYAELRSVGEGAHLEVFSARNDFAEPLAVLAAASADLACARGWLARDARSGRHRLTREGRRAVRRALAKPLAAEPSHSRAGSPVLAAGAPGPRRVRPRPVESPLAWLRRRKNAQGEPLLAEPLYEAGLRLASDYAKAQMQPRVTASWSPTASCHRAGQPAQDDVSDFALAARTRLHKALEAAGPDMTSLLVDVCCHEIGMETAEKQRKWPPRSGKVVLDMGLTALARHYGLLPHREHVPSRPPNAHGWRAPGYATTLDHWS